MPSKEMGTMPTFYLNEHVTSLLALRADFVQKRRLSARHGKIEEFERAVAMIEAVDAAIVDEKRLAYLVD